MRQHKYSSPYGNNLRTHVKWRLYGLVQHVTALCCVVVVSCCSLQVYLQLLSADGGIDPEVVAINAASAALLLARNIPFTHPAR
jgi:hypothetical protein